jgi:hypothetical protein
VCCGCLPTAKKNVTIPVVNVNTVAGPVIDEASGKRKPSSAAAAFNKLLGDAFPYHKLADLS